MMINRSPSLVFLLFSAFQVGYVDVVYGQNNSPYEPLGLRAGAFTIFPTLSLDEVYTSNVRLENDDETSDLVTLIRPQVTIKSGWSVHSLELVTGSNIAIHSKESDEDYQDAFVRANTQVEVRRATRLDISADAERLHVGRDDPDDDADDLVYYQSYGAAMTLNQQFVHLALRGDIGVKRDDFDSDEDDQDSLLYQMGLRSSYTIGRGLDLFVEGRYNIEDRDQNIDDAGLERDSRGYEFRLGVGQEINALISGEAFLGYRLQKFDEPTFDDQSGLSFGANIGWRPTQLTTIGLTGNRDFETTDEEGAASNFRTSVDLSLAHELRRNIILNANAGYSRSDFRGDDRKDNTVRAGIGARYLMNRRMNLNAGYDYTDSRSNEDGQDFQAHSARIGVTFQL